MNSTSPGLEFLDALRSVVELEYWAAPHTTSASRTPLVVWRYVQLDGIEQLVSEATQIIEHVLANRGVQWELRKAGRNWLLAPKKFLDLEDSGGFRTYPEVLEYLENSDPKFGEIANTDLCEIAMQVRDALKELTRQH